MSDSLYDRLGGQKGIEKAVEVFYAKVLRVPALAVFFTDVNMAQQESMMTAFLAEAGGGPEGYTGRNLREVHAGPVKRGMNEEHFELVLSLLSETLSEIGVAPTICEAVVERLSPLRHEVLGWD